MKVVKDPGHLEDKMESEGGARNFLLIRIGRASAVNLERILNCQTIHQQENKNINDGWHMVKYHVA